MVNNPNILETVGKKTSLTSITSPCSEKEPKPLPREELRLWERAAEIESYLALASHARVPRRRGVTSPLQGESAEASVAFPLDITKNFVGHITVELNNPMDLTYRCAMIL